MDAKFIAHFVAELIETHNDKCNNGFVSHLVDATGMRDATDIDEIHLTYMDDGEVLIRLKLENKQVFTVTIEEDIGENHNGHR